MGAGPLPCKQLGAGERVKLFGNLGGFNHKIFTKDPNTQALFNQASIFPSPQHNCILCVAPCHGAE